MFQGRKHSVLELLLEPQRPRLPTPFAFIQAILSFLPRMTFLVNLFVEKIFQTLTRFIDTAEKRCWLRSAVDEWRKEQNARILYKWLAVSAVTFSAPQNLEVHYWHCNKNQLLQIAILWNLSLTAMLSLIYLNLNDFCVDCCFQEGPRTLFMAVSYTLETVTDHMIICGSANNNLIFMQSTMIILFFPA